MPNHIHNKLQIVGSKEEVEAVMNYIRSEELGNNTIDFNKITKMPDWVYGSSKEVRGISLDDEVKYLGNTSLDWSRENWGTKWNAYAQPNNRNTSNTIYFNTAWNAPLVLISKIAVIFPNVEVHHWYADEDIGYHCGYFAYKDTDILHEEPFESKSDKAIALGIDLVHNGNYNRSKGEYE